MDEKQKNDEQLFTALEKNKKKKKKKVIRTIIIIVLLVAALLTVGTIILRKKVTERFGSDDNVVSAQATIDSISTTVSGSGSLSNVDEEAITLPAGVAIKEVKVSAHDSVQVGDLIATLDMPSVMSAMSELQSELDSLDDEISEASDDTVGSSIYAGLQGRVKIIYAEAGESVLSCMYDHGSLAVLSLDGYMAVEIKTDGVNIGDPVTVTRENGKELTGVVESYGGGKAVILVSDNGPEYDETVTVADQDGNSLGSGELYIHNPVSVTGVSGTISRVNTSLNSKVYASSSLFSLKDTSYSAGYDALLAERKKLEETLLELISLYRDGALLSSMSGSVSSIDYDEDTFDKSAETQVATISPDIQMSVTINVDESDILNLEPGQTAQLTVSSLGDDSYEGVVSEINKTASSSSGVTKYSAVITLDKQENMLAGMSTTAVIRIQGVDNAVIIPVEALHQTSSSSYVYTEYNEETKEFGGMVEVETGISNSSYVEIISGLNEGDTVYYTEAEEDMFNPMSGNFPGGGDFGGDNMPGSADFGGGSNMPGGGGDFGGGSAPGGSMPGGSGNRG